MKMEENKIFIDKAFLLYDDCKQLSDDMFVTQKNDKYHIIKRNQDSGHANTVMELPVEKTKILPGSTNSRAGGFLVYDYPPGFTKSHLLGADLQKLFYGNMWELPSGFILAETRFRQYSNLREDYSFMLYDMNVNPPVCFDWPWEFDEVKSPHVVILDSEIYIYESVIGRTYTILPCINEECAVVIPNGKTVVPPAPTHETYDRYDNFRRVFFGADFIAVETYDRHGEPYRDCRLIN